MSTKYKGICFYCNGDGRFLDLKLFRPSHITPNIVQWYNIKVSICATCGGNGKFKPQPELEALENIVENMKSSIEESIQELVEQIRNQNSIIVDNQERIKNILNQQKVQINDLTRENLEIAQMG